MLREPIVCGKFYPATAAAIKDKINSFLPKLKAKKTKAIAAIMPHAGYVYSGEVAVNVAALLKIPENIILLGPNHSGFGPALSIMSQGQWKTPMGTISIEESIARKLLENCKGLSEDTSAHSSEHCLEVELPILQYFSPDFKIVPIIVGAVSRGKILNLGEGLAKTIEDLNIKEKTLLIASTDMTHYESQSDAQIKDKLAIEQILKLSAQGLLNVVSQEDISMCGAFPTAVVLAASSKLGAKRAKLIKYQTSGKASGDYDKVVGYAGFIIK